MVIAVVGSRSVAFECTGALVSSVLQSLSPSVSLAVGCCVGIDSKVIRHCVKTNREFKVFAAFGPNGLGSVSLSAVSVVQAVARWEGRVSFWAGGGASVPVKARLARRSQAVVAAGKDGLIAFVSTYEGHSFKLACQAAKEGKQVLLVPLGPECVPKSTKGTDFTEIENIPFLAFSSMKQLELF